MILLTILVLMLLLKIKKKSNDNVMICLSFVSKPKFILFPFVVNELTRELFEPISFINFHD